MVGGQSRGTRGGGLERQSCDQAHVFDDVGPGYTADVVEDESPGECRRHFQAEE